MADQPAISSQQIINLLASVSEQLLLLDTSHSQAFLDAVATAAVTPDKLKLQNDHLKTLAAAYPDGREPGSGKPFVFAQGYAVIPVHGALLNRFAYSSDSATGYNFIRSQLNAAMADPDVESLIYDISSTGGHAAGCFELCAEIFAASETKPSLALVDPFALSGGQAIAAAASQTWLTPSSYAGSIGVMTTHINVGTLLEKMGVEIELLHKGARKVDGNPFGPLTDEARKSSDKRLDDLYSRFTGMVAQMRNLSEDSVRATEADVYSAEDALERGLIDGISSPEQAIMHFRENRQRISQNRIISMPTQQQAASHQAPAQQPAATQPAPAQQPAATQPAPAQQPAAEQPAAEQPAAQTVPAQESASGADAERLRVKTILGSEEGKANPALAEHLAFETSTEANAALSMLKVAGPGAGAAADPLTSMMDRSGGGPGVPAAPGEPEGENAQSAVGSTAILSAMGLSPGAK